MKILAIETSTMLGGVAVMDEDAGLIAETRLNVKTTHSERLMTVIDSILRQSELSMGQIDVFGVAIGPGSFTGLRIGLSAAKGLCYSTGKPLVAVPTLEAFAWNFPHCAYPVCLMLDARKGEVYAAMFGWAEGKFCRLSPETPSRPEEFLAGVKGRVLLAGEGTLIYREKILEVLAERALFASPEKMVPSPANVGLLGLRKALAGDFLDPVAAVPLYLRRSEAELKWKEKS